MFISLAVGGGIVDTWKYFDITHRDHVSCNPLSVALIWRAAERYARQDPDDPDVPVLLDRVERGRHEYLAWGRDTFGWSLYLFR